MELQRQLGSQEKEKSALLSAQSKLKISQKKVESLSWEVEVLQQKYDRATRKYRNFCPFFSKFDFLIFENVKFCKKWQKWSKLLFSKIKQSNLEKNGQKFWVIHDSPQCLGGPKKIKLSNLCFLFLW